MNPWTHKYALLARRELWEHKSLWMAPAITAVAVLVLTALGARNVGPPGSEQISISGEEVDAARLIMPALFGRVTMLGVAMLIGSIACITIIAYLLDCLYAERKDRSIQFWKSLPVGDVETVMAKVLVALLIVPLLALLLSAVVQPLMLGVMSLRQEAVRAMVGFDSVLAGYRTIGQIGLTWLYGVLWYAPLAAWLMLASVLAQRLPLMYAVVPVFAVVALEWMMFDTRHVAAFLGGRLAPWTRDDWAWAHDPRGLIVGIGSPDWSVLYFNMSLWLGLAATAVMVYIVIRLRRYRDDT